MKAAWLLFVALAHPWPARSAPAESSSRAPDVGSVFEIRISRSSQQRSAGGSGNSRSTHVFKERVVAIQADGLELEYDVPDQGTPGLKDWHFPVRVHRPSSGILQILNQSELEDRLERWLQATKLMRSDCGRSIFTWNAFRVDCDPRSVIDTIQQFDLRSVDARPGAPFHAAGARNPVPLVAKGNGADGSTLVADMEVDPDSVRRKRAERDVVAGEMVGRRTTLEEALKRRAKEAISGTISATVDIDAAGQVKRRAIVTTLSIDGGDGHSKETEVSTETVERRLLPER